MKVVTPPVQESSEGNFNITEKQNQEGDNATANRGEMY